MAACRPTPAAANSTFAVRHAFATHQGSLVSPMLQQQRLHMQPHGMLQVIRTAPRGDLGLEDGWGVEVAEPPPKQATASSKKNKATAKQPVVAAGAAAAGAQPAGKKKARRARSPYMDMNSSEGMLGLTLLQQKLLRAEAGKASLSEADQQELLESLPEPGKPQRKVSTAWSNWVMVECLYVVAVMGVAGYVSRSDCGK